MKVVLNNGDVEYCDKIKIGETLETAIKRSLTNDFGLELIDFDVLIFQIDVTKNKSGESLSRIPVEVYVKLALLKNKIIVDCMANWTKREIEAMEWINSGNDITRLTSNGMIKEQLVAFISRLYQLGAIDVFIDELEQEPGEVVGVGIGIRLPSDKESRKKIFTLYNDEQNKKILGTSKLTDERQQMITFWIDVD